MVKTTEILVSIATMKNFEYTIERISKLFEEELSEFYPIEEINGFIKWTLGNVLNHTSIQLILNNKNVLTEKEKSFIFSVIERLKTYEPIQYILGETEFYGLKFKLNPAVLIPRPETEELVDWIIKEKQNNSISILDIGTGSGCIAIALKKQIPLSNLIGIDISKDALEVAKENAVLNDISIDFREMNIFDKYEWDAMPAIDIIVSNPPYILENEKPLMEKNVLNYEPHQALFVSNVDPLIYYREILEFANKKLNPNGAIYFEINESKGEEIKDLLINMNFTKFIIRKDLRGKDRMIKVTI